MVEKSLILTDDFGANKQSRLFMFVWSEVQLLFQFQMPINEKKRLRIKGNPLTFVARRRMQSSHRSLACCYLYKNGRKVSDFVRYFWTQEMLMFFFVWSEILFLFQSLKNLQKKIKALYVEFFVCFLEEFRIQVQKPINEKKDYESEETLWCSLLTEECNHHTDLCPVATCTTMVEKSLILSDNFGANKQSCLFMFDLRLIS
jgi:hypothetical protein